MTTAMQPAICAKLVLSEADVQGYALRKDQLEHGDVDQPDADHGLPIDEEEICLAALSCFKDLIWPSVSNLYALCSVLSLVSCIICVGKFQRASFRSLLVVMWNIYVDDSNMVGFMSNKG